MTTLNGTYYSFNPTNNQLPNGGGSYQSVTPTTNPNPLFTQPKQNQGVTMPKEYINPATGKLWTPQEYANNVATRLPISKNIGDVPQYTADQFTQGPQTANQLANTATTLNNARNDIATGTTDPYDITQGGTVVYTPAEKEAIRKAQAGIYDPSITSALYKLDQKQKEDAALVKAQQDRENQIFATNENIRQWKATTGTKSSGSDTFTQSQINNGASNAGMTLDGFSKLDTDLQNFYINPPMADDGTGKKVPLYKNFEEDIAAVKKGDKKVADVTKDIMDSNLPQAIKTYFIGLLPLTDTVKQGYFTKIWNAITGQ